MKTIEQVAYEAYEERLHGNNGNHSLACGDAVITTFESIQRNTPEVAAAWKASAIAVRTYAPVDADQLKAEFVRQVALCSTLGEFKMLALVDAFWNDARQHGKRLAEELVYAGETLPTARGQRGNRQGPVSATGRFPPFR